MCSALCVWYETKGNQLIFRPPAALIAAQTHIKCDLFLLHRQTNAFWFSHMRMNPNQGISKFPLTDRIVILGHNHTTSAWDACRVDQTKKQLSTRTSPAPHFDTAACTSYFSPCTLFEKSDDGTGIRRQPERNFSKIVVLDQSRLSWNSGSLQWMALPHKATVFGISSRLWRFAWPQWHWVC